MLLNPLSSREVFEVDEAEVVAKSWWLYWPDRGLYTLAVFVGAWVLVHGVLHVVGGFVNRQCLIASSPAACRDG